jgi:hypothetical protein
LERKVACPLHRCHERRKVPLLFRYQIETLTLEHQELVDVRSHPRLIGRLGGQLTAERLPRRTFFPEDCLPPRLEASADRRESAQLIVRETHAIT